MEGPQVKGIAFLSVLTQLERARGEHVVQRTMTRVPPDFAESMQHGWVVTSGWYPIEWYRALWHAIQEASGEGTELVRFIGRETLRADITTVYRPILKLLRPTTMVSLGAKYFNRFYDTGTMRVVESNRSSLRARFEGCKGFDHTMWVEMLGAIEAFVELAGHYEVSVTLTKGGGDHDGWAEMFARW